MDFKKTSDSRYYISQSYYSFSHCSEIIAALCISLTTVVLTIFNDVFVVFANSWQCLPIRCKASGHMSYKCQTARISFAVVVARLWKPVLFTWSSQGKKNLCNTLLRMEIHHFRSLGSVMEHLPFPPSAGEIWESLKLDSQEGCCWASKKIGLAEIEQGIKVSN